MTDGHWTQLWNLHNALWHEGWSCLCGKAPMSHCIYADDYDHENPVNCPECDTLMYCIECWIGGGSHYWVLRCPRGSVLYTYDTYRFEIEKVKYGEGKEHD